MVDLVGSVGRYVTSIDNTQIYYNTFMVQDSKKVLVFLHGLGGDSASWNTERELLSKSGYSSIAIDLRGHGLSDRPRFEGAYSMDNFVEDVLSVLKQEKLEKVVLVGHCFGAMVALRLEADYPATARALVLIDTSYKPPAFSPNPADHRVLNNMFSFITRHAPVLHESGHVNTAKFYGSSDFSARRILSDVLHTSLRSYLSVCEQITHLNAVELLARIIVPTLVLVGTQDLIFPPEVSEKLQSRIKGSEITYIEGGNHMTIINKPGEVATDIKDYLKKINY